MSEPTFAVTESNSFEEGAKSCLNLAGLGKLSPNMMLVGFKTDWVNNLLAAEQYFAVLQGAFDLNLAVGILRWLQIFNFLIKKDAIIG